MQTSKRIAVMMFFVIIMITPGPICYLLYRALILSNSNFQVGLLNQNANLSVILSTFAFTMLGFLAAVITLMFSFAKSRVFRKYKNGGYLANFFFIYYFAIGCLVLTFFLALLGISESVSPWFIRGAVMSSINNMIQICLLTIIIVNLCKRAIRE